MMKMPRPVMVATAALAIAGSAAPAAAAPRARIREAPGHCALLGPDDRVLFEAVGRRARAECLRRATETGIVRIVR